MSARLYLLALLASLVAFLACSAEPIAIDANIDERRVDEPTTEPSCGEPNAVADGWPCRCDSECGAGAFCFDESQLGVPGGLCQRSCASQNDCASGLLCMGFNIGGTQRRVCIPGCRSTADCPPAWSCSPSDGYCFPICQDDSECNNGQCNRWAGRCIPTPETGARTGEACFRDEDCLSLLCSTAYGVCSSPCSTERQGCPERYTCISTAAGEDWGVCALRCAAPGDCEGQPGSSCQTIPYPSRQLVCF